MTNCKFPKKFIWGAAAASYQIEGAWKADGKGESIWDRFSHTPGKIARGETGDVACDHYHKYKEDVELIKQIGLHAYRLSVSWPRIFPNGAGKVNPKGLDFYDRLIDELLKNDITPFFTLYHWDLPQKLEDKGGWRNKATSYAFADYAKEFTKHFSDRVTHWMTQNEMICASDAGYKKGSQAPGAKEDVKTVNQVRHNLMLAHGLGVLAIRANTKKKCEVGLAHNSGLMIPKTKSKKDLAALKLAYEDSRNWDSNGWWLEPIFNGSYPTQAWENYGKNVPAITPKEMKIISTPIDFYGLNVYFGELVEGFYKDGKLNYREAPYPKNHPKTSMDWDINTECTYYGIKFISENYKVKKFYITENGAAFNDVVSKDGRVHDKVRVKFLKSHVASAHRLFKDGINLAGYFVWSLMDNYEWAFGYDKRFGLIYVDYKNNQKRILKDSALWYKEVIKNNAVKI